MLLSRIGGTMDNQKLVMVLMLVRVGILDSSKMMIMLLVIEGIVENRQLLILLLRRVGLQGQNF